MNWNWFTEGFDPTGSVNCITRAELLQMVHEAKPSNNNGMFVYAATAPDVTTYPDLARAIWGKTSSNIPTGDFYYYDGATWQPWKLEDGTASGDMFANQSIDISKFKFTGANPLDVLGVSGGGGSLQWAQVVDYISDGTIAYNKLIPSTNIGDILIVNSSLEWSTIGYSSKFTSELLANFVNVPQIKDLNSTGLANQVPALAAVGGVCSWQYVESLLRDHNTPVAKLQIPGGKAGQFLKVNATGDEIEFASSSSLSSQRCATVKYSGSGLAPQAVNSTTAVDIQFNVENDPDGIVALSGNQITLDAGTYLFDIYVPVYAVGGASGDVAVALIDVTASNTVLAAADNFCQGSGGGSIALRITHAVKITASNIYKIQVDSRVGASSAFVISLGYNGTVYHGWNRGYQQWSITKTA